MKRRLGKRVKEYFIAKAFGEWHDYFTEAVLAIHTYIGRLIKNVLFK